MSTRRRGAPPVWDRLEHDLVERIVTGARTPCVTLGLTVLVGPVLVDPEGEYPVAPGSRTTPKVAISS